MVLVKQWLWVMGMAFQVWSYDLGNPSSNYFLRLSMVGSMMLRRKPSQVDSSVVRARISSNVSLVASKIFSQWRSTRAFHGSA